MYKKTFVFTLLICCIALSSKCAAKDLEKVAQVKNGTLKEARADWWGFDDKDATQCLQDAINSKVPKLIVPNMGKPWIVNPIFLVSDQEIVFEDGVVVEAIKGGFKGKDDDLFSASSQKNITLRGTNAILRMRKKDYHDATQYQRAEWRHTIDFRSCENVKVIGLTLQESGGDGVYISECGKPFNYCKGVVIKDCKIDGSNRQGISVISVVDMLVENCVITNTRGTNPQAGMDFEPNARNQRLFNIRVKDCIFKDNAGGGVILCAHPNSDSKPISFVFENCTAINNRFTGGFGPNPPVDLIDVKVQNCVEERNGRRKVYNDFWKDWQNMQLLDAEKEKIIETAKRIAIEDVQLTPLNKEAYAKGKDIRQPLIRWKGGYAVYLEKEEEMPFKITLMRDYGKGMTVRIVTPSGKETLLDTVTGKTTKELHFTADEDGVYMIKVDPGPGWFQFDAGKKSVAAVAIDGPLNLFNRESLRTYYFYVPAGTPDFYVQVAGQGDERVKAQLINSLGVMVEEKDQISVIHRFFGKPEDSTKGEIWELRCQRPSGFGTEDFSIELFGIPSVLAVDKGSLLKTKDFSPVK